MSQTHKVLGQLYPATATSGTLYTVPSATQTICSTLSICNTASSSTSFRVAILPTGEAVTNKNYLCYDSPIAANDSVLLTLGISLNQTDVVSVYANSGVIAFNLFGVELA
jgi:hypothetical protein